MSGCLRTRKPGGTIFEILSKKVIGSAMDYDRSLLNGSKAVRKRRKIRVVIAINLPRVRRKSAAVRECTSSTIGIIRSGSVFLLIILQHVEVVPTGGGEEKKNGIVEALQFHSTAQSHWSTVCFPSNGSVLCILGMHKLTMEPGFSC